MTKRISEPTRIVVIEPGYVDYKTETEILAPFNGSVHPVRWGSDARVITEAVKDADAVLTRESPISAEAIAAMEKCRVIVRYGVGTDNIDLEAARLRSIPVANVPSYGLDAVSDHAIALMLAVNRRIVSRDREVRAGAWGIGQSQTVMPLRGACLGLYGFGHIARRALEKFRVFGFERVLVSDPSLSEDSAKALNVEPVDLDTLCAQADVISVHAPLNDSTLHAFDAAAFGRMKSSCIIINTGRGPIIEQAALVDALHSGRIFGAGIDVFETEPPQRGNPLFTLDNVVVSDHTGWYSEASVEELQSCAAKEVARVFSGQRPQAWVNRWED